MPAGHCASFRYTTSSVYLFWPLLIGRLQLRKIAFVAAGICVAEPIIRGLAYAHVSSVLAYSWFRLDGLASGALIACFVRSSSYSSRTAGTLVVGLVSVGALLAAVGSPFAILQHRTLVGAIGEFTTVNVVPQP